MPRHDDVVIPSLTLDHDEVSERRTAQPTAKRRLNPPPARPTGAPSGSATVYKKPSMVGVYLLLLLILGSAGGAGYWLWQQNQILMHELQSAKGEIENLDHQLLAADVSANEQGTTVEQTLKNHESEIRKLWAVAYDRNRKSIATNEERLTEIDKKVSDLKLAISTQAKLVAVQGNAFNDVEAGYNQLINSVVALEASTKTNDGALTALRTEQAQTANSLSAMSTADTALQGRLEAQSVQVTQVLNQLDGLEQQYQKLLKDVAALASVPASPVVATATVPDTITRTLKDHQEAIDSNDAFRAQVNGELNRLDNSLGSLSQQIKQIELQQQLSGDGL